MREWMRSDVLEIGTRSASGDREPINVIHDGAIGDGGGIGGLPIAIHMHDAAASPEESTLASLPNLGGPFQATMDVFMPGKNPPDGTVTFRSVPRWDTGNPQVINAPNWASEGHLLMVMFGDFAQ